MTTLTALTIMIFLVSLGLLLSAAYFLVEAPAEKKKMRTRLATAQQLFMGPSLDPEVQLLRDQALSQIPTVNRILLSIPYVARLQTFMNQAAMEITAAMLLMMCLSLSLMGFLAALLMKLAIPLVLVFAAGGAAVPIMFVSVKRQRRLSKFEESFPDAIEMLSRAVRAGHAFTTGFELIAREMPEPVAGEFQITYEQQNLGMPLREALSNLAVRVPSEDVRFFITALQIQRESGGNLAEILDKLAYVVRERFKILRQVKVFTAEARMSLYILTAVPPLTGLMMYFANREYIMTLFNDPTGRQLVAGAVVLQIVGYFVMRQITKLKV